MGRILAIDYGMKRVGLAVSDPLKMIATGLTTVDARDAMDYIKGYVAKEEVEEFAIGEPKNLDNSPSELAGAVNNFVARLQKEFPHILINKVDERFTSKIAFQSMIDSGMKKKDRQNKALLDEISATIILQSYLEMNKVT